MTQIVKIIEEPKVVMNINNNAEQMINRLFYERSLELTNEDDKILNR